MGSEIGGQKRKPEQDGDVDAEHNVLSLVEVCRQRARFECVTGAHTHQHQVEADADQETVITMRGALLVHNFLAEGGHGRPDRGRVYPHGDAQQQNLARQE